MRLEEFVRNTFVDFGVRDNVIYKATNFHTTHIGDTIYKQFDIVVTMPNGNEWCVGYIRQRNDEKAIACVHYEWHHRNGAGQKQPKEQVRIPVEDKVRSALEGSFAPTLIKQCWERCDRFEELLNGDNGDNERKDAQIEDLQNECGALRIQLAQAEKKAETPSIEGLVMGALVDNLMPALQLKAEEMAEEVINHGVIPRVLKVEVDNTVNTVEGVFNEVFSDVLCMTANEVPVFLTGPAGSGKNVLAEQVADALKLPFHYMAQVMDKYTDCVGFADAKGEQHDTPLIRAAREGGLLFIDEIDASIPEVLITVNALLANGYFVTGWGEFVKAHKDFRVIVAGNTMGTGADTQYNGRYKLDDATLDRFAIVEVNYDHDVEMIISGGDDELVTFIEGWREALKDVGLQHCATYRATKTIAKLCNAGMNIADVVRSALVKSIREDDVRIVKNKMSDNDLTIVNNKFYKAIA